MRIQRIWAVLRARNREFFRDREAFGWNFVFPFLIIAAFAVVFGQDHDPPFTVGIFPVPEIGTYTSNPDMGTAALLEALQEAPWLRLRNFETFEDGLKNLRRHQIDLLLHINTRPLHYWINDDAAKGIAVEKLLLTNLQSDAPLESSLIRKQMVSGRPLRYVDWLFPGVLAMNMMFSALWGVGYVVVRYRKNGVLKRLQATPLTSLEYLSAQLLSRVGLLMFIVVVMWYGCDLLFNFVIEGSSLLILLIFLVGSLPLCALGLLVACRGTSEEFAGGLINFIAMPMMLLSEVWFALDGSALWVQRLAAWSPLYHINTAVRAVMLEGVGLPQVMPQLLILSLMALAGLLLAAALFSWHK